MSDHKRFYAKGYFDGQADAENGTNKMLTEARAKQVTTGLTSVAKKVLEAVPIGEPWSVQMIISEVARLGYGMDPRITQGCVNSLVQSGLVKESPRGKYRREPIKTTPKAPEMHTSQPNPTPPEVEVPKPKSAPIQKDAIDVMSALAERARTLSKSMASLAEDIDRAALDISDQIDKKDASAAKLKQLQSLLREIA